MDVGGVATVVLRRKAYIGGVFSADGRALALLDYRICDFLESLGVSAPGDDGDDCRAVLTGGVGRVGDGYLSLTGA